MLTLIYVAPSFYLVLLSHSLNMLHKGSWHYPHLTDGETEAGEGKLTCPRSLSRPMTKLETMSPESQSKAQTGLSHWSSLNNFGKA